MRVDLSCRKIGVSELFLDKAQVGFVVEHMRRAAVAEFVRSDVHRQAGKLEVFFQPQLDGLRRHGAAALGGENAGVRIGTADCVDLFFQRAYRDIADGNDAFFVAFAQDAECFRRKIDACERETAEFTDTQTAAVKRFEHRRIANKFRFRNEVLFQRKRRHSE